MKFLFPTKESEYGHMLYGCLKEGFEKLGNVVDEVHRENITEKLIKEYDYTFLFSVTSDTVLKQIKNAGGKYLYMDKGYCRSKGVRLNNLEGYVRISINSWQPLKYLHKFEDRADRWSEIRSTRIRNKNTRWRNGFTGKFDGVIGLEPQETIGEHEGSYILLAGSSGKYHRWQGSESPQEFAENTIKELRKYTDRPIIYRPKPTWGDKKPIGGTIWKGDKDNRYSDLLDTDLYAVITHTSNAALEANFYGIPTMTLGNSIVKSISSTKISDINNIYRATVEEKNSLGRSLSYFQWKLREIKEGLMWIHLKNILEEELNES